MTATVAIITVNYGTAAAVLERVGRYLPDLAGTGARLFLVDNASPGGDGARLEAGIAALAPTPIPVTVLQASLNGGFAAGNNLAFAYLRQSDWQPDAVLLLNPDAEPESGAVTTLLEGLLARPEAGFVGPTLVNDDGSTFSAAFHFPSWRTEVLRPLGLPMVERFCPILASEGDDPVPVDWIGGASLMIRWQVLQALGDLDEGFFLYLEEVDYQRVASRQGWQSWHLPAARVWHAAGETTGVVDGHAKAGRTPAYLHESWTRYFAKHHGIAATRMMAAGRLGAVLFSWVQRRLRGRPISLPERFVADYLSQVLFRRLDPLPRAATAGQTRLAPAKRQEETEEGAAAR